jgi:fructose-bisphosphate aldolase class II
VHIDLSKLPFEENVAGTKKVADYVHAKNPETSVEGELGYLMTDSSKVYTEAIEIPEESLTKPEQAVEFVKATGVNRFSGAYGNLHGISLKTEKKLDLDRIRAIRAALPEDVALVLHGGSGTNDEMFKQAIEAGIANIHINTEIRIAYSEALRKAVNDMPTETTPYKFFPSVIKAVQDVVEARLRLFGSVNRV